MSNDKVKLFSISIQALAILAGFYYWYQYTERKVWGFLLIMLLVAPLIGYLISLAVLAPFVDTDAIRKEEEAERLKQEADELRRKQEFDAVIQNQLQTLKYR